MQDKVTLSPDFAWVGEVQGFFSAEFVTMFRRYTLSDQNRDEDFLSLPQFFLSDATPDFPDYVYEFVHQSRDSFRSRALRKYLIRESCLWNPVSTLIAILALEGMIQISRMPMNQRLNYELLVQFLDQYPYWLNRMGVPANQPAARLAIDTFHVGEMTWRLRQMVL